ncbi:MULTISPECIES: SNF2-related protein [unclassified Pantoea]|uniref:SNF2-related protein n=1 Tax=unclassified Pantoea TaxID=2630326 RepID=UPI001CD64109|nr:MULTISPECIES: SNF2-related protein [unclassified Pantoea]MCA1175766.1 DEAD/DEAH box helicase [Pantoea sp. alder69]MCA1253230.1 DEAD/DEAH box helicase [Pantoea sp. alder70]MCA1263317.1 DEAD/DEAH box helicase [Pantoea sp. alder81]
MTQTIANSKVDMNPHQVEAALFALSSLLSSGVILADEVGLGKTIEASLVLAQKWAERKRKLLLIVPATLRKQWGQELEDKFSLPSAILEATTFSSAIRSGIANPFDVEISTGKPAICICSYEFAARKEDELTQVHWDLVVLDEAHRLRNIYKTDGAKTAKKLELALKGRKKVMLSATPLQNSILELYGLVSILDPHFFGDLNSFKARYGRQNLDEIELALLRSRLSKVCNRTLRRQVQEEGGVSFTRRYSMTEDFRPSKEEEQLYAEVSEYLQRGDLLSIKSGARHLVTLVIRKILASSSYAMLGTLETMINRLEQKLPLIEALQDLDSLNDYQDEDAVDDEDIDPVALSAEIELLRSFKELAAKISGNAKAEALLRVLTRAFDKTTELGGSRKAVIFTESVRTQSWLAEFLVINGYNSQIVLLNGSNNDATSKAIYKEWLEKHQGSTRISGSKTADMKAALVDKFKEEAILMICTEAGAEGINLQFCSLLVNYDLPWNPQRVEQRIGRIHRYGQKHDVVVVNFINKGNRADERVFELLSQKFLLFEGVFGASDEILGSIESGVDIERRIHDIYQNCRSDDQIEHEFNQLQEQLKEQLEVKVNDTRRSLLENFDADVVERLNTRRNIVTTQLSQYQKRLLLLANMAFASDCSFVVTEHGFNVGGTFYSLDWHHAVQHDHNLFRVSEGLGLELLERYKVDRLVSTHLPFVYQLEDIHWADVRNLISQNGILRMTKVSIGSSEEKRERLILAAITDTGEIIHPETVERMLQLPIAAHEKVQTTEFWANLDNHTNQQVQVFISEVEHDNEQYYADEVEKLERWAEDKRIALDIRIKQLDQEIKHARKASRQLGTLQEKMAAKRSLKSLERERDQVMLNYHEEKKIIEQEEDKLLEKIEEKLVIETQVKTVFEATWGVAKK